MNDSASSNESGLTVNEVLSAAMASIEHSNNDVRNAAMKIVLDVQRLTGKVKEHHYACLVDKKTKEMVRDKISEVQLQIDANYSASKNVIG